MQPVGGDKIPTIKCIEVIFTNILSAFIPLAIIALFVMLIIGGFKFMTSRGDHKATASAQNTLTYAVAGILLMAVAYLVFVLIKVFTGVDVLRFEIPSGPTPPPASSTAPMTCIPTGGLCTTTSECCTNLTCQRDPGDNTRSCR